MRLMIVFRKVCKSLNKFWKFYLKNLKVLKFFESFKENVNKHFEKLNENYNFLLLSILIAGCSLGCSHSFAIVPGFWGKLSPPSLPLGYATGVHCTVYNEMKLPNFLNFQSNANKYAIDLYRIPLVEEGKSCVVLTCHEWNH